MRILAELGTRNEGNRQPFLIGPGGSLAFDDIRGSADTGDIKAGDVVALIGGRR